MWTQRKHYLDRMTLGELTLAYFQYPAIQAYIGLLGLTAFLALRVGQQPLGQRAVSLSLGAVVAVLAYPLVWYLLHRFVLHGQFLYRSQWTAALWKRIHYDHHKDPDDLRVLFGALRTTLPTIAVVSLPLGSLVGGMPGAAAAVAAALGATLFYEFCHCAQHLRYTPRSAFLRRMKHLHLLHHYHNEHGNYGITNFLLDRVAGTYYSHANDIPGSETVFNLGYVEDECTRYPWVARLSKAGE